MDVYIHFEQSNVSCVSWPVIFPDMFS